MMKLAIGNALPLAVGPFPGVAAGTAVSLAARLNGTAVAPGAVPSTVGSDGFSAYTPGFNDPLFAGQGQLLYAATAGEVRVPGECQIGDPAEIYAQALSSVTMPAALTATTQAALQTLLANALAGVCECFLGYQYLGYPDEGTFRPLYVCLSFSAGGTGASAGSPNQTFTNIAATDTVFAPARGLRDPGITPVQIGGYFWMAWGDGQTDTLSTTVHIGRSKDGLNWQPVVDIPLPNVGGQQTYGPAILHWVQDGSGGWHVITGIQGGVGTTSAGQDKQQYCLDMPASVAQIPNANAWTVTQMTQAGNANGNLFKNNFYVFYDPVGTQWIGLALGGGAPHGTVYRSAGFTAAALKAGWTQIGANEALTGFNAMDNEFCQPIILADGVTLRWYGGGAGQSQQGYWDSTDWRTYITSAPGSVTWHHGQFTPSGYSGAQNTQWMSVNRITDPASVLAICTALLSQCPTPLPGSLVQPGFGATQLAEVETMVNTAVANQAALASAWNAAPTIANNSTGTYPTSIILSTPGGQVTLTRSPGNDSPPSYLATFSDPTSMLMAYFNPANGGTPASWGFADSNSSSSALQSGVPLAGPPWEPAAWGAVSGYAPVNVAPFPAATGAPVYSVRLDYTQDASAGTDGYTVVWYRDDTPAPDASGAIIEVIRRADGSDLIAAGAMTQLGTTAVWKHDETVGLITDGVPAIAVLSATIDGAVRTRYVPISRDG